MFHIFISHDEAHAKPGATGRPIPGYVACVMDAVGNPVPPGEVGLLAVKGPTGCRYLADERQSTYVKGGWNYTGDAYLVDADGDFVYQARTDDMIVSAGYNIAGPEVEAALLLHPAVAECGVVGVPDEERGQIVKAFVVLKPGVAADAETTRELQDHVKQTIAPYKYPRAIEYLPELPRTETGKLQRGKAAPESAMTAGDRNRAARNWHPQGGRAIISSRAPLGRTLRPSARSIHPPDLPAATWSSCMNAPERVKPAPKTKFVWDDPLLLDDQLTEEERMVRDAAHSYAQEKLLPRVTEAFRHETSDPAVFRGNGRAGAPGRDASHRVWRRGAQLRLLRPHRPRSRARGLRLPVDDERAKLARDVSDLYLWIGSAAQEIPAEARCRANGSAASG